jgi:hypothetical protein
MTERDGFRWQSGCVLLPSDREFCPSEARVYRRCPACGGYFRTDDFLMNIDNHECQRRKRLGEPAT